MLRRFSVMSVTRPQLAAIAALTVTTAAQLAGCTTSMTSPMPWWYRPGVTTCGPPAQVRIGGHATFVGGCDGTFGEPTLNVTVQPGEEIDVHMTQEPAGPTGSQIVPIFPLPRSSQSSVVEFWATSSDRATGAYRAVRSGYAVLLSQGTPILDVTVNP
jgi:hypothetical protein